MPVPSNKSERPLNGSPSSYLERMLAVLETAVLAPGRALTVTEIAQLAGAPLSTSSRLLAQLVSWEYLADAGGGHYVAGPRLVRMAIGVTERLHSADELARATRELCVSTGESVTAAVFVGPTLMIVARTESQKSLRAVNRIGEVIAPSRSALGKAMLSRLPRARQLDLLATETGGDAEEVLAGLEPELEQARADGYARDEEVFAVGLRCRAAAIVGRYGEAVAGLSIGGPSARFTLERAAGAVTDLLAQSAALSAESIALETSFA